MSKQIKNNTLSFNEKCYALLMLIPKGKVTTYKIIAEQLDTKAYQAVGNAMATNPNPIKVPCHRVVNSNGAIGNYAFGIEKKIELLHSEGVGTENGKIVDFKKLLFTFN